MFLKVLLLLVGVFCCSTAVIMIKLTTVDPLYLSAYRLLLASLFLSPCFWIAWRKERSAFTSAHLKRVFWPALFLGIHFISWIVGARLTWSANASLIVNLVPIVMPFLMFFLMKESINRSELLGTVFSICGLGVLATNSYTVDPQYVLGDLVCFGSMLFFAVYLALGRLNRDFKSLWLYLVPCYGVGGVICFLAALVWGTFEIPAANDVWNILGLVLIPTILGHSLLNWGLKRLRGQVVAVLNLWQFVFAGVMAMVVFSEFPEWPFYVASGLIVVGAMIVIRASNQAVGKGIDVQKTE